MRAVDPLDPDAAPFLMTPTRQTVWLLVATLFVGCAHWKTEVPTFCTETPPPFSDSGELPLPEPWWSTFNDSRLNRHVDYALTNNCSLEAAYQRLLAFRAIACREASDLFPDLNGVSGVSTNFGPGENRTNIQWGLDASYQVDLWGQIESRVEGETLRADASEADYQAIALTLSAAVTSSWFSLIEAHAQVELLEEQIETNRTGLDLQESRFAQGLIRSADVLRQRQLLESTLEQSVVVKSRIEVLEHQLAVLLGQMPQTARYQPGAKLPELAPLPATGMPVELLQRRPDVRRDYLAFEAADRDLAAAISAQFPRLNLTGSLVNATEKPENLLRDWFGSLASQLIAPLFDGGQRSAEVDRTTAVLTQRFYEYAQTVLVAFGEVEDSLAQEKYQRQRIKHLEAQVKLAGQASVQLREQYITDDAEYLDVLSAIQAQQGLQRRLLSAQLELILNRVSLHLALAGGLGPRQRSGQPTALTLPPLTNEPENEASVDGSEGEGLQETNRDEPDQ